MGQQRPGHARHLVGERHRHDLEGSPRQELREPGILLRDPMARVPRHRIVSDDENASQRAIALLRDRPELLLAASRNCAARVRSRPRSHVPIEKTLESATVATIAVPPITPIPGWLSTRWLASLRAMLHLDPLFDQLRSHSPTLQAAQPGTMTLARASIGNRVSCSSVMYGRRPRCKRNLTISEAFGCGHVFGL